MQPNLWLVNHVLNPHNASTKVPKKRFALAEYPNVRFDEYEAQFCHRQDVADVDAFCVHPTLIISSESGADNEDSRRATAGMKAWAISQVTAFSGTCRIFCPHYRNAVLSAQNPNSAWEVAYEDVRRAFKTFLKNWNNERPIVLFGHAQGSIMVLRLIKEFFSKGSELRNRLVAVYAPGVLVYKDQIPEGVPIAAKPGEPGTISIWATATEGATIKDTLFAKNARKDEVPVTCDPCFALDSKAHLGALGIARDGKTRVLYQNVITEHYVRGGILHIKGHEHYLCYYRNRNDYHSYDVHLFWADIRASVKMQWEKFKSRKLNLDFDESKFIIDDDMIRDSISNGKA